MIGKSVATIEVVYFIRNQSLYKFCQTLDAAMILMLTQSNNNLGTENHPPPHTTTPAPPGSPTCRPLGYLAGWQQTLLGLRLELNLPLWSRTRRNRAATLSPNNSTPSTSTMHCGEHCDSDESCHVNEYRYGVLWLICCTSFIPLWNKLVPKFTRTIQLEETHQDLLENYVKVVHVRF